MGNFLSAGQVCRVVSDDGKTGRKYAWSICTPKGCALFLVRARNPDAPKV